MATTNYLDYFTPEAIAAYWDETYSNRIPYLGSAFFNKQHKAGLDLKWIKGSRGLPVALMPSTFDAKAKFRDPIGFSAIETEMPFFREGYLIKEKDRQNMLRAIDNNDPYVRDIVNNIFVRTTDLVEGARVNEERMIFSLLAPESGNSGITISANGIEYSYDYDPGDVWKTSNYTDISATANDKWSASSTADPIGDIQEAKDTAMNNRGVDLTTAVMSWKTFGYLLKSESVKSAILSQNVTANVYITRQIVQNIFQTLLGVNVVVYNKQYKDESGASKNFMPDDYVTLLPNGNLGTVWKGTTPEEADLLYGKAAEVSIVDSGTAISRVITPHPVEVYTYVSEIALPSFERMDDVYLLKVN